MLVRTTVSLEGTAQRAMTTDSGAYEIRSVPAGVWTVNVRALGLTAAVNYTHNEIESVDPLPTVLRHSTEPGLLDPVTRLAIEKERPDWRGTLTAQYGRGAFHGLLRGSYYGGFSSAQPGFCDLCGDSYGPKTLVDIEVGYNGRYVYSRVSIRLP
jgi:hypothetical protein